jgi:hypothetical protein
MPCSLVQIHAVSKEDTTTTKLGGGGGCTFLNMQKSNVLAKDDHPIRMTDTSHVSVEHINIIKRVDEMIKTHLT